MTTETKLRVGMVISALLLIWTTLMWNNQIKDKELQITQLTKQVDSLEVLSDSLKVELFPVEVELARYQVAYELFTQRNPKAASQFGDIISDETE
jgi:hypothetical protein